MIANGVDLIKCISSYSDAIFTDLNGTLTTNLAVNSNLYWHFNSTDIGGVTDWGTCIIIMFLFGILLIITLHLLENNKQKKKNNNQFGVTNCLLCMMSYSPMRMLAKELIVGTMLRGGVFWMGFRFAEEGLILSRI